MSFYVLAPSPNSVGPLLMLLISSYLVFLLMLRFTLVLMCFTTLATALAIDAPLLLIVISLLFLNSILLSFIVPMFPPRVVLRLHSRLWSLLPHDVAPPPFQVAIFFPFSHSMQLWFIPLLYSCCHSLYLWACVLACDFAASLFMAIIPPTCTRWFCENLLLLII